MTAEEYIEYAVVGGFDQEEYVSKEDALLAVKLARQNPAIKFSNKRNITADEVRGFLCTMNAQLEHHGFRLHTVHFDRHHETGELQKLRLAYEESESETENNTGGGDTPEHK